MCTSQRPGIRYPPLRSIICAWPALPASPLGRMARMRPSSIRTAVSGCTWGSTQSVGFVTAAALVHELIEARDEKRLLRLQRQLAGYKLLIIDELGYVPLSTTGAELLFEIFSQRYERGSTIVTSNLPFDEWTGVFGSPNTARCHNSGTTIT